MSSHGPAAWPPALESLWWGLEGRACLLGGLLGFLPLFQPHVYVMKLMEILPQGQQHIQVLTLGDGGHESEEQSFRGGQCCWRMLRKAVCPGLAIFLLPPPPQPFYRHHDKHAKMLFQKIVDINSACLAMFLRVPVERSLSFWKTKPGGEGIKRETRFWP